MHTASPSPVPLRHAVALLTEAADDANGAILVAEWRSDYARTLTTDELLEVVGVLAGLAHRAASTLNHLAGQPMSLWLRQLGLAADAYPGNTNRIAVDVLNPHEVRRAAAVHTRFLRTVIEAMGTSDVDRPIPYIPTTNDIDGADQ